MNVSAAADRRFGLGLPLRNFSLSLASKFGSLAAHMVFVMFTVRLFTKEEVAVIAVAGIATILMDVSKGLGLGTVLLKSLPQMGEEDAGASRTLVRTYWIYSLLPPLGLALAGLWGADWIGRAMLGTVAHGASVRLGILAGLFIVLSNTNILILQAAQQFGRLAAATLATAALQRLAPCLAAIALGSGLEGFLLWSALASALGFLATAVPVAQLLGSLRGEVLAWRAFWPESRHFYGTSLLRYGATQVDQLFVAALFPPTTLAVYYMLRRLYSLGVVLIGSMIDALVPELARQAGEDPAAARARLAEWSRLSLFAGTTGAALMAGNGPAFIQWLLGPGYGDDPMLIALFAASTSLYFLYCFVQVDLMLFQAPEKILWMAAATAAANVTAGPLASLWLGVHSIPLAMLCGYLFGLAAARWKNRPGIARRPVWRIRELGAALTVVALASIAPRAINLALDAHWERFAAVNMAIAGLAAIHYWRTRVGDTVRRLGQPAA